VNDLEGVATRIGATGVVVDAGSLTGDQLNDTVHRLSSANLHVHITSGLRGVDWRRITVSPVADETVLHIAPTRLTRSQEITKRCLDVALAGLALAVGAPILALVAAAIFLGDRGPVLFRQTRVGQDGEHFTVYKFRTMVVDAERRLADLHARNARMGPLFKLNCDPRVTRVGRVLRATSLDELPQLFNVLEGTMSLVGPRPALPTEVAIFDERLLTRTRVKPGVTGLWQVEARDLSSFDLYRRYDLLYVESWSIALDVAIIGRTVTSVFVRGLRTLVPARAKHLMPSRLE
jgi:exopolysaccharide biosynthesis polyprenyl glycosylphosphotransferase